MPSLVDVTTINPFLDSAVSMKEIEEYLERFSRLIEDPMDFHFEETEEALFNWIHRDSDETPMEIKNALMPSSMVNVLHVAEGWFFWFT